MQQQARIIFSVFYILQVTLNERSKSHNFFLFLCAIKTLIIFFAHWILDRIINETSYSVLSLTPFHWESFFMVKNLLDYMYYILTKWWFFYAEIVSLICQGKTAFNLWNCLLLKDNISKYEKIRWNKFQSFIFTIEIIEANRLNYW